METESAAKESATGPAVTHGGRDPCHRIPGVHSVLHDLLILPRGFWIVIGAFVIESMAYFGILTLMTTYFSTDLAGATSMPG